MPDDITNEEDTDSTLEMANDVEGTKKEEFTNQLVDEIKMFGSEYRKYRASSV